MSAIDKLRKVKQQAEDYNKNTNAPKQNSSTSTATSSSSNSNNSGINALRSAVANRDAYNQSVANERANNAPERFHLYGKTYTKNVNGGYSVVNSNWRQSERDRQSVLETGHETFKTDLEQLIHGRLETRKAGNISALSTLDNAIAAIGNRDNNYQPEVGSALWMRNIAASEGARSASELEANAKAGRSKEGQLLMDVGASGLDVALDSLYRTIGINSMIPMAIRSFGQSSQEKRDEGKSVSTQIIAGAKSAAIEYFTEKMWGIGGRKIEGGGYIERLTKHWENNLIERCVPAVVEKMVAAFGSEAIEEMMSDILNPIFDKGFSAVSKRLGGDYEESGFPTITEILYDGLVGGLVGLGGGISEGINIQREINSAGDVHKWVTAERNEDQRNADSIALGMVKDKMSTKDGKAQIGKLFKAKVANYFATERGIKTGNEMADDFFKAWEEVKAEEFKDPTKALGKVIEKYEERRINKLFKTTTDDVEESGTAQYIDTERTDEENAATTELLRDGIEPEAPQADVATPEEEEYTDNLPFIYGEEDNGNQELQRDNEGRVSDDVRAGGERSENGAVSPDNERTQQSNGTGNRQESRRTNSEAQEVSPNDRVNDAVRKTINKRFGTLDNGEVNEQKASSRREHAQAVLKQAGINDDISKALLKEWADNYRYAYKMAAEGNVENSIKGEGADAYYEGLASTQLLGAIAEGDSPSLINVFREAGMSDEQAKLALGMARKALMNEGYFSEANVNASKRNGAFNPNAQRSATRADYSGKDKATANITDYNPDFGKAETVTFGRESYVPKQSDTVIGRVTASKQTGYLKNTSLKSNHYYDVIMRSMDNYLLVDEEGKVAGVFDEAEKAFAAAKGASSTYIEARVKLASGMFAEYSDGHWMTLDLNRVYNKESYKKSIEEGNKFSSIRFITRNRSHASDLMGVKYSTYKDAKTTTESLTIDLRGANQDDIANVLKQLIDTSASGAGIKATNGKTYIFAGQTASMRKNGVIQLMEKSAYDKCRERMTGFLTPEEIDKVNPAKYLANLGFMFTPSNDDTDVKIKDCVVLPDYFTKRYDVTNDFMFTDMKNDRANLTEMLGKEKADKAMANAKIGFIESIIFDVLESNSTDGFGFVWSDKQQSFQMRSVGGIKGLLQGFDFYKYLSDNMPVGDQATPPADADYFYRTSDGDVWAKDRWGQWVNLKGKKALLFESTVKFASKYGDGEEGQKNFYSKIGEEDIRSVPRENVYGSNADAGMVDEMKRRGLTQFLRKEYGFTNDEIKQISDYYMLDIENRIMNDPKLLAKMFAADFGSMKSDSSSFESVMVSLLGEKFFGTPLGQKWAVKKLSSIAGDFKSGKLYMTQDESYYGWIAPDVIGLFNKMANISYKGYSGLAEGEINNQRLKEGVTVIGRNPSAETNDVQIRKNELNEAYASLVENYGLDPEVTLLALSDNLALHLDNDYDGDTATLYQGFLAKSLDAIRERAAKEGKDYTKATIFTHTDPKKGNTKLTVDELVKVVTLGMDAESVGIFDNAIDILNSFSDKQLSKAVEKFNKDNGVNYNVQSFRDLMMARFATAYKFNFDYAKQGYYPAEFKKVVNETLEMIDDILYENEYQINWADSNNEVTSGDNAVYENGRRKKVKNSAYPVPETWRYSKNPNKVEAYNRAYAAEKKEGNKYILKGGSNALAQMNRAVDLSAHQMNLASRVGKANAEGEYFRLTRLSTHSPSKVSSFGMTAKKATSAAKLVMAEANRVYQDKSVTQAENSRKAQKILYDFQKSLGFDNEQFTSFMLYALQADTNKTNLQTLFNLNQNRFDKSNTEPTTAQILLRNAKMLLTYKSYNDAVQQSRIIQGSIEEVKAALDSIEITPEDSEAYNRMMALKNVIERANTEIKSLNAQFDEVSEERNRANDPSVFRALTREARELLLRAQAIYNDPDNQLAHKEYKQLKESLHDLTEALDLELNTLPELEESLAENDRLLQKNEGLYEDVLTRAWYYGYEDIAPDEDGDFSEFTTAYQNSDFYNRFKDVDVVNEADIEDIVNQEQADSEQAAEEAPAPVKAPAADSKKENWKRAVANFGAAHRDVSNAVRYLVKNQNDRIKALNKAFTDINNGVTTDLTEAVKAYDNLRGTEYYTDELYEDLKRAQRKFETDADPSAKASAVATVARMIGHYASQQEATTAELDEMSKQMKPVAYNYDKNGIVGKIRGKLTRYQYTPQTMFKRIFGYDPNSVGYKLANEVETSAKKYMALISRGNSFHNGVAEQDGYEDFFNGKTKLSDIQTEGNKWRYDAVRKAFGEDFANISTKDALYVLSAYEELQEFRSGRGYLNPYYNPYWVKGLVLENGKTIDFKYGDDAGQREKILREGFDALRHIIDDSDMLKDYKAATKNLLDAYGNLGADVATKVYGVQKKNYNNLPLFWATYDNEGNLISQSANDWNAERYIKDPSVNVPYNKEANNYLKVVSMPDAINAYVRKMSDFVANKEFRSYLERMTADRGTAKNLIDVVGENYGADYAKWVKNYVDDITLERENDSLLKDVRIAMQKGALIGNPSTIIKQSSSYWSAAGVLSMKSLMKARGKRFTIKNAGADTDIVRFRMFTKAMAPELNEILEKNDTAVDKVLNKLPGFSFLKKGITWMDSVTVNNLFTATVFDCLDSNPGLDPASEQFREKVIDKFEEVVIYTQPMFNKSLRAEYGRTQDEAIRMLSMFRTQQTQNLNRLATTIGEYQFAKKNGLDTAESRKALGETIKGQGMAAMSVAIFTILADFFKHKWKKYRDDDGDISAEKITERFVFNAIEAAAGTSWFADELAKVAIDTLSGGDTNESYGISMGVISTANSALDALTAFGKDKSLSSARYAAGYIAQMFGIPLNNAYSYLNTFAMAIAEVTGQNPKDYDDIIQLAEKNNKIDKNLKPAQKALMDTGMSKKEANNFLLSIDVNLNGKLNQEEIENLYYEHPESAGTLQALWDMQGWSKTFGAMTKSADKKRTFNSNPIYSDMDEDKSESVSKTELMNYYIDHPEIRDDLEKMYTDLGFKDFKSAVKSADKKIKFRSNPLYAEMDEDENESVSKSELTAYAIEHPEMYDTLAPLYKELGFKGTFRSAIRSAESTKIKEAAEDAFYDGDYNALFESVSQMKNGKTWLTNMVKDEYPDYETMENPLLHYLTDSGLSTKQIDSAVESFGGKDLVPKYKKLRETGLSPKQAVERLDIFDADDNGRITQAELAEYFKTHRDEEAIIAEFWEACGWSKTWKQYKKSKKIK